MQKLPLIIIEKILIQSDIITIHNLSFTNKYFYFIIKEIFIHYFNFKKLAYVKSYLLNKKCKLFLIKLFKDDVIINLRYLDIKNRISLNGCINFINKCDFDNLNTNILYGYDIHDRFFFSFIFFTFIKNKKYYKIITIYQRYIDNDLYLSSQDKLISYPYIEKFIIKKDKVYSYNKYYLKDIIKLINDKCISLYDNKKRYTYYFDINY